MKQLPTNKVQAPEIYADFWFNSAPLTIRAMQGQAILLCFWDCMSESSLRLIEFVREWARRYDTMGLAVIGIHSPEFSFARDPKLVERTIQRLGIGFPVATDNTMMMHDAYRVQEMPVLYLIDRDGSVYLTRSGEGNYEKIDRAIQGLLREVGFRGELPVLMEVAGAEEYAPAGFERFTPAVRTGYLHGSLGNVEGYSPELPAEYEDPGLHVEGKFYAHGRWLAKSDAFVYEGEPGEGYLVLRYSGNGLHVVMSAKKADATVAFSEVKKPIPAKYFGEDLRSDKAGDTVVVIDEPRLFHAVRNQPYGERTVTLRPMEKGITIYSISFGAPPASLLHALSGESFRNN